MAGYHDSFMNIEIIRNSKRSPAFDNILKILNGGKPARPTLFELGLNINLDDDLTRGMEYDLSDELFQYKKRIDAFRIAGYDYAIIRGSDFCFYSERSSKEGKKTISLNEGAVLYDRESFEKYPWPDPEKYEYSRLERLVRYLPEGMKIIVTDADGILETAVKLVGYERLCLMLEDDPELLHEIFLHIGSRWVRYHEICASFDSVGGHIFGDDWGFNSQTMISPDALRKYVFPWHRKEVEVVHAAGKKAILHSCGNLASVFDDIVGDLKYDAKHSFEDKILPVEDAYEKYTGRIAILGGIDVDFLCRSTPEEVYNRSVGMLERSFSRGGYALGSGNSIPVYVPRECYFAMTTAALMHEN